jgi:hypothetical protein
MGNSLAPKGSGTSVWLAMQRTMSQVIFHLLRYEYYRLLEATCRREAAIAMTPAARTDLERMALEYKRSADWLERQWPETDQPK